MAFLIQTAEDEAKFRMGAMMWDNIALRHELEALKRQLAEKNAPDIDPPAQPDLA